MLKAWLELARISNLPTAWTNVLAGWLLAGGQLQDQRLLWLLLGGSLLYSGGMILNDAADAGYDREHRKERPIPRGAVSVGAAWSGGLSFMVFGVAACVLGGGAGFGLSLALVAAILGYNLYHKPWAGSVIVMGSCRTLLYLVAASGVLGLDAVRWSLDLWSSAVSLGCYVVGLSLLARQESRPKESLRGVFRWLPICLLLMPTPIGLSVFSGGVTACALPVLFLSLVAGSVSLVRRGGQFIGQGVGWLLAGIVVVDALAISNVSLEIAIAVACGAPLLRLWQRKIAAT